MKNKKPRIPIKKLLISVSLFISIIPIIILSMRSFFVSKADIDLQFEKNGSVYSEVASNILNNIFDQNKNYLSQIIETNVFDNSDENNERLHNDLKAVAENSPNILDIYYSNELKQTVEGSLSSEEDYTDKDWYKAAINNPECFMTSPVYLDSATHNPVITISKAVYNDGILVGVIAVDIDLLKTSSELDKIKINGQGDCFIVDKSGLIIFSTDKQMIQQESPVNNYEGTISYTYNDESYRAKASDISGAEMTAVVSISETDLNKTLISDVIATLVISIIIIIISVLINIFISNKIYKDIKTISKGIDKTSKGDFSEKIEISMNNEFLDLCDSFNSMTQNVSVLIKNVSSSINEVDMNSKSLNIASENVSDSMNQVAKAVDQITEGTFESAKNLEDISININDLSEEMKSMQSSADNVNTISKDTESITLEGIKSVDELKSKSKETLNSTNEVKKIVDDVYSSVKKIETMNETIASITEETNMLALNAAIESARAGDAGKGFAVVAEQIKKLAEQTATSATEINSVIKDIEERAKVASTSVENVNNLVINQDSVLVKSAEIFNALQNNVDVLTKQITNVHEGILKVNTMKDNVNEKIQSLSVVMEETAASSEEVSASAKEVNEASLNVVKNSNDLEKLSSLLGNEVNKFIISK